MAVQLTACVLTNAEPAVVPCAAPPTLHAIPKPPLVLVEMVKVYILPAVKPALGMLWVILQASPWYPSNFAMPIWPKASSGLTFVTSPFQ